MLARTLIDYAGIVTLFIIIAGIGLYNDLKQKRQSRKTPPKDPPPPAGPLT